MHSINSRSLNSCC